MARAFCASVRQRVDFHAGLKYNDADAMITEMTATGGVMILGIGLLLLEIKRVRVANFLPALVIAPLLVALWERWGPG